MSSIKDVFAAIFFVYVWVCLYGGRALKWGRHMDVFCGSVEV